MKRETYTRQQLLMYIWLYAPQYSFLAMKVSEQVNNMWPNKLLQLPTFALLLLLNCSSLLLLYVFELISYFYEYVCIVLHSHTQHQQQLYIWCENHIASLITFQARLLQSYSTSRAKLLSCFTTTNSYLPLYDINYHMLHSMGYYMQNNEDTHSDINTTYYSMFSRHNSQNQ